MPAINLSNLITAEDKQQQAQAQLQGTFETAVQAHLDQAAKAHGYDNIITAISYADEPSVARFQRDGLAFRAWRSGVWQHAYEALADVKSGARATPTLEGFLAELPALDLPSA